MTWDYFSYQQEYCLYSFSLPSSRKAKLRREELRQAIFCYPPKANPAMISLLIILFLSFPTLLTGTFKCPTNSIAPCKCTENSTGNVEVDCSNAASNDHICSALKVTSWPSDMPWWVDFLIQQLSVTFHSALINETQHIPYLLSISHLPPWWRFASSTGENVEFDRAFPTWFSRCSIKRKRNFKDLISMYDLIAT